MTQLIPGVPVPEGEFQTTPAPTQQPDGTLERGSRLLGDETVSFSNWTWRAALDWDLTRQNFLYLSYETGLQVRWVLLLERLEHLRAYMLGTKSRLLADRLLVDVEAFHWRYDDQQISTTMQDSRGVTNLGTLNVGDATMNGDATYDEFQYVIPLSAPPPLSGCAVSPDPRIPHLWCSGGCAPGCRATSGRACVRRRRICNSRWPCHC